MNRLIILVSLMALMLCSCASSNRRHMGTWDVASEDTPITARFADETVDIIMADETKSYRYVTDYTKTPTWIDVTTEDGLIRGIMEFVDKDTLRIATNEADKRRPTGLESAENVAIFKRVENEKPKNRKRVAAGKAARRLLGTWKGIAGDGDEITLTIEETLIKVETGDQTNFGEYSIDSTKTPIWLDFSDGEDAWKSIIEFTDKDSFRLAEPDEVRPSDFGSADDVVVFRRVKDKR